MKFEKSQWLGNKWPCIYFDPYESWHFLAVLTHLHVTYKFQLPEIMDTLDGYAADFQIDGCEAMMDMDNWAFSVAFADEATRDRVYAELTSLPPNFFEVPERGDG